MTIIIDIFSPSNQRSLLPYYFTINSTFTAKHLITDPLKYLFCFPLILNVSQYKIEGNISILQKTTLFPLEPIAKRTIINVHITYIVKLANNCYIIIQWTYNYLPIRIFWIQILKYRLSTLRKDRLNFTCEHVDFSKEVIFKSCPLPKIIFFHIPKNTRFILRNVTI